MTVVFATIERNDELNFPHSLKFTPYFWWDPRRESNNRISLLLQELESMVNKMQNEKEKDLVIENRFHRQLIGPKGETIQQIRDR